MWRSTFRSFIVQRWGVVRDDAAFVRALGQSEGDSAADGSLNGPLDVCVAHDGHIVVADTVNNRIQVLRRDGTFVRTVGRSGDAPGELCRPHGVCVNSVGHLIVSDTDNNRIEVFSSCCDGTFLRAFGSTGSENGQFISPWSVRVDGDDNIVVADSGNHRVQVFSRDGTFLRSVVSVPLVDRSDFVLSLESDFGAEPELGLPSDVCVACDGSFLVADASRNRIVQFGPDGTFVFAFGSRGTGPGQFRSPMGVCVDGADNIFVADTFNSRVQQFRSNGTFVRVLGSPGEGPFGFRFRPRGLCVGADGALFVSDSRYHVLEYR